MEYFEIEGAPGRYFDCPAGMGRLSENFCAGSYKLANEPKSIERGRRFQCRHCKVGAGHAGKDVAPDSLIHGSAVCQRCGKGAWRLVHGRCVSCYNRTLELKRGFNRKGQALARTKPLIKIDLIVAYGRELVQHRIDEVSTLTEAAIVILKTRPGGVFGRPAICFDKSRLQGLRGADS